MVDLNAEGRALIEGYRRARQPNAGLREHIESEIARRAQHRRSSTIGVGCAALVAVAAGLIVVIGASGGPTRAADTNAAAHMAADQPLDSAQRRVSAARSPSRSAPTVAPPERDPAVVPSPERAQVLPQSLPQPKTRAVRPASAPPLAAPQPASLLLLRKAQRSLASHPKASLEYLAQYQQQFGLEHAAHEWRALRVLALCGSGNRLQGRGEGVALTRVHPQSPYTDRIVAACAAPKKTP